ncbi:adenosylcobinamide-GDP ribazoletransferase [Methylovorus sp. MM2]|uniref:adenosylcobinamide-GDP ribazoletransferase n=1 Tax=Methylovorus sp. MM2 TaxID=1848038 RepID=UPI000A6CE033|nr:adenosylcobinamide-GDP ribazoletransferase [Methylovorus sp. MM2]
MMTMHSLFLQELRRLILAIGFFTRLPVPYLADFHESELNHAARYFPLIGILIGLIAALIYWIVAKILPVDIAVITSMIASIYLTGAFHEDGLADAADGLGGGWDKEQVLTIMQDSRIGSYGAIALVMALLAKFELLINIQIVILPFVLIAAHAVSRFAAVAVIYTQDYVRSSGKAKPLATKLSRSELVMAGIFGLLPMSLLPWQPMLLGILAVIGVWCWFSFKLKKRLGGYTGDCLGAMQQLTEIAFYAGFLIWKGVA